MRHPPHTSLARPARKSSTWLLGGWFTTLAVVIAFSVAADARVSTSALLFAIGVAPAVIMMLLGSGAPPPTVAELLHSVEAKDGR